VLVEQSPECCAELYREIAGDEAASLVQADFLTCDAQRLGGLFDAVLMNPPFKMGADIKHIKHALTMLAPGGRLVSICANGPKQCKALQPTASQWIELPPRSFAEAATNVEDFSKYFGSPNLSDKDVAAIPPAAKTEDAPADDLYWLTGQSAVPPSAEEIQKIVSDVPKSSGVPESGPSNQPSTVSGGEPTTDLGELVIPAKRPVSELPFEEEAAPEEIPDLRDLIGDTQPPADDLGEIVGERPVTPVEPVEPVEPPVEPVEPVEPPVETPVVPPVTTPPVVTSPPVTPPKVTPKQVAQILGVPMSSPLVLDVIEALYGTMEYLDIGEEFDPSSRKVTPAATQKQQQQTKMAQGGYLDTMLAEEMSVDDLLKLLR
jgi:hypothetical protein